jgi:hypothetical protein
MVRRTAFTSRGSSARMPVTSGLTHFSALTSWAEAVPHLQPFSLVSLDLTDKQGGIYNILFVLVFGFATLNILNLVARRFEPERSRSGLSFGETMAVTVVLVSIVLLGWELLTMFKIFPIKLHPR